MVAVSLKKNFFKQKTAYEITTRLVGSEMCIRDRAEAAPYSHSFELKVGENEKLFAMEIWSCLLYTSDAADD